MACNELTTGIDPNCEALRKPGGLNKRAWVGVLTDLSAVVFDANNQVTSLTFSTTPATTAITAVTSGTIGTATITVSQAASIKVGYSITVTGTNGNQTSGGATIIGQAFVVTAIAGNVLTVDKEITGITPATTGTASFTVPRGLRKFIGKREKHNTAMALEIGDNFNLRNHGVNLVAYYSTQAELNALDALIDVEGLFMIVETNSGELEVWGINRKPNWSSFGLSAASLDGGSGVAILDSNIYTLGFTGNHETLQGYFASVPGTSTLVQDIAILDGQTI